MYNTKQFSVKAANLLVFTLCVNWNASLSSIAESKAGDVVDIKVIGWVLTQPKGHWTSTDPDNTEHPLEQFDSINQGAYLRASSPSDQITIRLKDRRIVRRYGNAEIAIPLTLKDDSINLLNVATWSKAFSSTKGLESSVLHTSARSSFPNPHNAPLLLEANGIDLTDVLSNQPNGHYQIRLMSVNAEDGPLKDPFFGNLEHGSQRKDFLPVAGLLPGLYKCAVTDKRGERSCNVFICAKNKFKTIDGQWQEICDFVRSVRSNDTGDQQQASQRCELLEREFLMAVSSEVKE
jgi:hypothetical protein